MKSALIAALLLTTITARAAEPVDMAKRTEELKNLKWGMFICWSFSTFSGKEWTPGVKDISLFAAKDCDTDQWARTAKEAGMGYILFLTKHHDGFCLWDTKTTDRNVTKAPLGRDVLAELKKSCDKYGIKLALYFSEGDWTWPDRKNSDLKKAQLKELLTQYGPIEYIWFDHAQTDGGLSHEETVKWCKSFQPGCFIGFNHGAKAGDIRLGEMGRPGPVNQKTGIGADQGDASYQGYLLAEFTYPILPGHQGGAQWFYSLPTHDNLCRSAESLYKDYLGAVKYGNIFSIDVGPDYTGKLRAIDGKTLRQVGEMIKHPPPIPLSQGNPAKASSVWGAGFEAGKAFDGDEESRWGAAPESRSGWIEVDLGTETEVNRAVVMEIHYPRTQKFAIEYKNGDTWKPVVTGTSIAGRRSFDFALVKARYFRLNILEANDVPTIEEFQLYAPGAKLPASVVEDEQKEARLKWFREAKFGMFITWGLYSVPGGIWNGKSFSHPYGEWIEWIMKIPHNEYAAIADTWEPKQFDADAWAKVAKDAGMKYLLITAKFHDGFLMYPSKVTGYNIHDRTPWKRDPVKELSEACARQGLKFGVYWNQVYDWQNPNGLLPDAKASAARDIDKYINEVSLPQLREMLVDHPLISFIWFDQARGTPEMTYERGKKFADLIHSVRPDIIFNSRLGGYPSDYQSMGDNAIPGSIPSGAWETAATINHTWGYKSQDTDFKSATNLIRDLIDVASKGGNLILNIGPTGDGVIPAPELDRLKAMGDWLKLNGEAIYGSGRTVFGDELKQNDWRCTTQPGKIYIHIFKWSSEQFILTGVRGTVANAYLLADRKPLALSQTGDTVSVSLPSKAPGELATVMCLEVKE